MNSNHDLSFRLICPFDVDRIVAMINRDPYHLRHGISAAQFQQDLEAPGYKTSDNTFVVKSGTNIVGYFSLSLDERGAQINADCFGTVDCHWRRNGIGTEIFRFIFSRLQELARQEKKPIRFVHRAVKRIPGETAIARNFGMREQSTLEILRLQSIDRAFLTKVSRPSGIRFRTPSLDDACDWADIYNEAFSGNRNSENVLHEFKGTEFLPDFYILAVDHSGNAVGFICSILKETFAQIPTIAVKHKFQGQGVGKALLAEELTRLDDCGVRDIRLSVDSTNSIAKSLYSKFGFQLEYKRVNYAIEFAP